MADEPKPESNGPEPHSFPGLVPVTKRLSALLQEVATLEADSYELKLCRKILMENLGIVESEDTTHSMLLAFMPYRAAKPPEAKT